MFYGNNDKLKFKLVSFTLSEERDLKSAVGHRVLIFTDNECARAVTATIQYGQYEDINGDIVGKDGVYSLRYDYSWDISLDGENFPYTWEEITPDIIMYEIYS